MTKASDEDQQWQEWESPYEKIKALLARWGTHDYFGKGDYLIVDDNYGWRRHMIEAHSLRMISPTIAAELQKLLVDNQDWEIEMSVSIPGKESWPPMGIVIRPDKIVDALQRGYLPPEFQNVRF